MLDDAVTYTAQDSRPAAERLLTQALDAASSLDTFSERGRLVPELDQPSVRQLLVQRYRLLYESDTRGGSDLGIHPWRA
jgi:plasmid stabilization system protein ParE